MAFGAGKTLPQAPADTAFHTLQWAEWERGIEWGDESPKASNAPQEEFDDMEMGENC